MLYFDFAAWAVTSVMMRGCTPSPSWRSACFIRSPMNSTMEVVPSLQEPGGMLSSVWLRSNVEWQLVSVDPGGGALSAGQEQQHAQFGW